MNDFVKIKEVFEIFGIELERFKINDYLYLIESDDSIFINKENALKSALPKFDFITYYYGTIRIEFNKDLSLKMFTISDNP